MKFADMAGLTIVASGKIQEAGVFQYREIPLKYELHREKYALYLHAVSILPAIEISGRSASGEPLDVSILASDQDAACRTGMGVDDKNGLVYTWLGGPNCRDVQKVEIAITTMDGTELGRESLPFSVAEDGFYCVQDGI